jgi:hypothetical protein
MRICPFDGCQVKIADEVFACRRHWFSLNAEERRWIKFAYNQYLRGEIEVEKLREIQQSVLDRVQSS